MAYYQSRDWKFRICSDQESDFLKKISVLEKQTGFSSLVLRVCLLRGLETKEQIQAFLFPRLKDLPDPWSIYQMRLAVERFGQARKKKEKVRIFSDYDVDGTCGAAVLDRFLSACGFEVDVRQPNRFEEGYGLSEKAVLEAVQDGVSLLVTVDCGITSFDAAKRSRALGCDLIIIDHHQVAVEGVPPAIAILNPHQKEDQSGLEELCGCGVAFYFALALRAYGREKGWFNEKKEPHLKSLLDLVVLATAADQVPLKGVNRILVRHGLEVLLNSPQAGMAALMEVAGIQKRYLIHPSVLGFVLGPRINAAGRMSHARSAFDLLRTDDPKKAQKLALCLEQWNRERVETQQAIWDEVRCEIEARMQRGECQNAIVVGREGWHEGVVGIVASKIVETYHRPAVVIAFSKTGIGKGSGRSFGGKPLLEALNGCRDFLESFGGHAYAAGLKLKQKNLQAFEKGFEKAIEALPGKESEVCLWLDGTCQEGDFSWKVLRELECLAPFGPGNPEPVFLIKTGLARWRVLKDRHLKFWFPKGTEGIWFYAAENKSLLNKLSSNKSFSWAGVPELNRYQGRETPTFRVRDWKEFF